MSDVGLNQKITAGSRNFHIQTATLVNEGIIRAEVFEKGRVLFVETFQYERRNGSDDRGANGRLRRIVDQFHQSIIEEVDCLFEISERICEERLAAPHERIGLVFLFMRIFDKAEKHFKAAIELEPNRSSSYIYLARSHFLQKKYNRAAEIMNRVLKESVAFPDLFNLMGLIMMEKRSFGKSFQYFKSAIDLNPTYIEAYFNLAESILRRLVLAKNQLKEEEIKKGINFVTILLKKIEKTGNAQDRQQCRAAHKALGDGSLKKTLNLIHDYRENSFLRRIPPEIFGYKFYLRLVYGEEELSAETLALYEVKINLAVQYNPSFPDLWHYLALIHLMLCRHYFLEGMDNFRDATRINPNFDKALKNLRLVENDGREFLSLIKTIR